MFSDLLSFLRFVTDPETRKTLAGVSSVIAKNQRNWKKDIRTANAKFAGDEAYKVEAFANFLLEELKTCGVSTEKSDKFRIVLYELINNAFEHGCKYASSCRVAVRCTYSRWFIRLEVADSGKGFDLDQVLNDYAQVASSESKQPPHGLQVVRDLTYKLQINKTGNIVTAFLSSQDTMNIIPAIEDFDGQKIYVIHVRSERDWYHIAASWEPLERALENNVYDLVLLDCLFVRYNTRQFRDMTPLADKLGEQRWRHFALVVDHGDAKYFHMSNLDTWNLHVFNDSQTVDARQWLVKQAELSHASIACIHCRGPNRAEARFCRWCGRRLAS